MNPFDWNGIPAERMNEKLTRQVVHTGRLTIARLELKAGCQVPAHQHENEQVSLVLSGRLRFLLEDGQFDVGPGQGMRLAPNQRHAVEALEDSIVIDLFSPPREDWIRGDDAYLRR
ncbi:MAG: cupin domain-containing protein [Bryobacteraceae bacterium]|nr:cupin domain-containing protein [Bryobacteraceae bacterium]MCX7603377.1 cupin domain-containing protein [Bryobacteraceae bacterium]